MRQRRKPVLRRKGATVPKVRALKKGSNCFSTKLHFKRRRKWLVCINAKESEKAIDLAGAFVRRNTRPATTDAPQPKKSRGIPRKSSNNPSSVNPLPSMEQPPSSTQEHPSRA
ncbi:hypothetical protein Ancab_028699 [Ancistrocladus abbreviatus]